jgi:hypothetical protein
MRIQIGLVVTAACALGSRPAHAQDSAAADARPAPRCWRGRPLPTCRSFWLTEVRGEYVYATTTRHYRFDYGTVVNEYDRPDVTNGLIWTVGPMVNTSSSRAVGATFSAGIVSDGSRIALEARRRWWADTGGAHPTFDVSAGFLRLNVPPPQNSLSSSAYGVTAGGYLVGGDLVQLNLRGDLLLTGGRMRAGASAGVGLGSYAAAGATALAAALVGVAAILLANAHWD